jgi:RNA polymerase sigma-70 factor (ECF subfamily)
MVEVEPRLEAMIRAGSLERAATLALKTYGPELNGFLVHLMGNPSDAAEVFSQTAEDLWRGLPAFRGHCIVRTWLYILARHAAARFRRSPWNRDGRTGDAMLDGLVAEARASTAPWLRTEVKDRWRGLRESLSPYDRTLLVLRVDRDLSWTEVARVFRGDMEPSRGNLDRETARLRKRLQLLKQELRQRARAAGLLEEDS